MEKNEADHNWSTFNKESEVLYPEKLKSIQNSQGITLLHVAAKHTFSDVTKFLINIECKINVKNKKTGLIPLVHALNRNDEERYKIIQLMLESGADISWENIMGSQIPILFNNCKLANNFFIAVTNYYGSVEAAADHLLRKNWTLDIITCLGNEKTINYALSKDQTLNKNYKKLQNAITQQDVLLVKQLLQLVAHSKKILSLLLEYARDQSPKSPMIIKLLLDHNAPSKFGPVYPASIVALLFRNVDNLWVFLNQGNKFTDIEYVTFISCFYQSFMLPEIRNQEHCYGSQLFNDANEYFDSTKHADEKNCVRLLIEHYGVSNILRFIEVLSSSAGDVNHLRIEYL